MNDRVDVDLMTALDELHRLETEEGWNDEEVMGAQRVLTDTAAWLRGHRPPASWDEAWERIQKLRDRHQLRGVGGR